MRHTTLLAATAAAIALAAYTSDEALLSTERATTATRLTATTTPATTRATLGGTTGHTPLWAEGDKLAIVYDGQNYTAAGTITLTSGAGTQQATFSGTVQAPLAATTVCAIYPEAAATDLDISSQTATLAGIAPYIAMHATAQASPTPQFAMANKTAILHFVLPLPENVTFTADDITAATLQGAARHGRLTTTGDWADTEAGDIALTGLDVANGNVCGYAVVLPGLQYKDLRLALQTTAGDFITNHCPNNTARKKSIQAGEMTTVPWKLVNGNADMLGLEFAHYNAVQNYTVKNTERIQLSDTDTSAPTFSLDTYELSTTEVSNQQFITFLNAVGAGADGIAQQPVCPVAQGKVLYDYDPAEVNYLKYDTDKKAWTVLNSNFVNHPVARVSWYGAKAFCAWVGGDLPTECQWQYAAEQEVAGLSTDDAVVAAMEQYNVNDPHGYFKPAGWRKTHRVFDIYGNAWEWTADLRSSWPHAFPTGLNPSTPETPTAGTGYAETQHMVRGGSYAETIATCLSTRYYFDPDYVSPELGFRVARYQKK